MLKFISFAKQLFCYFYILFKQNKLIMNKLKTFLFFLLSSLFIISCSNNESGNDYSSIDFTKNFGNPAFKNIIGQVVDESNNPVENATINIGTSTTQTDGNGVFVIKSAPAYTQFAYVTAEKAGYIKGSRAVVPSDDFSSMRIMLFSNTVTATVNSGVASEVSLPNGAKINFTGGFETEDEVAYSGSVNVTLHYVDGSDANMVYKMPGMLFGATTTKTPRLLKTYGMMNVELRGAANVKLNISSKAKIKIPINPLLTGAPSSLSFWNFNEAGGYWEQDGGASKEGAFYVGNVSNASWLNSATPHTDVAFRQTFVNSNGDKLAHVNVAILRSGEVFPIIRKTNKEGLIASLIPSNEVLTLNVYDNCGNIIKTTPIGPFAVNTTSTTNIVISNDILPSSTIKGNLYKCDNTVVTNGYVLIKTNNQTVISPVPTSGTINLNTLVCPTGTGFSLKGGDYENFQTTEYINYTHTTPITNVGHLKTCNTVTEFISYKIDNGSVKYIVDNFTVNISGSTLTISGANTLGGLTMDIYGQAPAIGIYTTAQFTIDNNTEIGTIDSSVTNTISFNISQLGSSVGQYVDMTFTGTYMTGSTTHTITGVIHVKRD